MQLHHSLLDDGDDGSEEECDPFDQRKKKRDQIKRAEKKEREREKTKDGEKMSPLTGIVACGLSRGR